MRYRLMRYRLRRRGLIVIFALVFAVIGYTAYMYSVTMNMSNQVFSLPTTIVDIAQAEPHNYNTTIYFVVTDDMTKYMRLSVYAVPSDLTLSPDAVMTIDIVDSEGNIVGSGTGVYDGSKFDITICNETIEKPFPVERNEKYWLFITIDGIESFGASPSITLNFYDVEAYSRP